MFYPISYYALTDHNSRITTKSHPSVKKHTLSLFFCQLISMHLSGEHVARWILSLYQKA